MGRKGAPQQRTGLPKMKALHQGKWTNGAGLRVVRMDDGRVTLQVNAGTEEQPAWREQFPKYPPNWLRWLIDETASLAEALEARGPAALGKPRPLKKRRSKKAPVASTQAPSRPVSRPPSEKPTPEDGSQPRGAKGSGADQVKRPKQLRSSAPASSVVRRAIRRRPT